MRGHILRGEVELGARLEDQPLDDPLVVIAFQAAEQIALGRKEGCAFDLEHIGRKSLESDGRVGAARRWLEIVTDARLQIEIGTDRAAMECLDPGGLDTISGYAFALVLVRQPVDVAAEQIGRETRSERGSS